MIQPLAMGDIDPHTVEVWLDQLSADHIHSSLSRIPLSMEEQDKIRAFYFERDRNNYRLAHQYLRLILSDYLQLPPAQIIFERGAHGKPRIISAQNPHQIEFNIAHSGDFFAIAVGKLYPLGIDVEVINPTRDIEGLSEHCFTQVERDQFSAYPQSLRALGFFRGWARKEAYIKALGTGLSKDLQTFSVDLRETTLPLHPLIETYPDIQASDWHIWPINNLEHLDCAAALAASIQITQVNYRCLTPYTNALEEESLSV